jgi:hypothetical protein
MSVEDIEANHAAIEPLVNRICDLMGWERKNSPVFAAVRAVARREAVALGRDKLAEIIARLERPAPGGGAAETGGLT